MPTVPVYHGTFQALNEGSEDTLVCFSVFTQTATPQEACSAHGQVELDTIHWNAFVSNHSELLPRRSLNLLRDMYSARSFFILYIW